MALIPRHIRRNLCKRNSEIRVHAANEIKKIVEKVQKKIFDSPNEKEKVIKDIINLLVTKFVASTVENHIKGGLMGLAAVVGGLATDTNVLDPAAVPYLEVAKQSIFKFLNEIFGAICKLFAYSDLAVQNATRVTVEFALLLSYKKNFLPIDKQDIVRNHSEPRTEEFMHLLVEHINTPNPFGRKILLSWIKSVDYVGVSQVLLRKAALPDKLTRLTAISWISEFVQLGKEELVPYSAKVVGVILDSISDNDYAIRKVANQTNKMFRKILKSSNADRDVVRAIFSVVARNLSSECTKIRIQSLRWIATLSKKFAEILSSQDDLLDKLLKMLLDPSTEAVRLVLRVHARMAEDVQYFNRLIAFLLDRFRVQHSLLQTLSIATNASLVADCRLLLSQIPQVKVVHCFREANCCADALARIGTFQDLDILYYNSPPPVLLISFLLDLYGLGHARICPDLDVVAAFV
uniref:Uncharacterized protein n=1 Tax=Quercus lobata TaxID=97700 RepID=A0A7N2QZC6_QUELO